MGFGSFLFGSKGGFDSFYNPYIEQANATPMADFRGPRNYYKSIMQSYKTGDYGKMPGMGMFDSEIAKNNRTIDDTANPLAYTSAGEAGGPLAERVRELRKAQGTEDINRQRFGFAQDQLGGAARGLTDIANFKNQFNLQKNLGVAGLYNNTFQYRQPTQGLVSTVLGNFAQGAGQGLGMAATGGAGAAAS